MPETRAQLIERLFQAAADLPPAEREPFLEREAAGDPAVTEEVRELLRHLEEVSGSFLASPVGATDEPTDEAPGQIGGYPVLGELGRGGMGIVYRAMDTRLQREIAIKMLAPGVFRKPEWQARFQTEARLLASIHHPNIATIFSLEDAGGRVFLTMELVRGEHLADRIRERRSSLTETLSICQQICSALEAAHQKRVMHLDLKPLNVMITSDGVVKVLDFGLARSLSVPARPGEDMVAGTPGYMSPEQIRGGEMGPETDVWAFGCIFYECLTGTLAFPGKTMAERFTATLDAEPDWNRLPPELPDSLRSLLLEMLRKDRAERLSFFRTARRAIEEEIARSTRPTVEIRVPIGLASTMPPHNLPAALTRFIGRAEELERVESLSCEHRLVSLVGPGGAGKSRLVVEAARRALPRFPHGACFVELAPISDPRAVESALLAALGVGDLPERTPRAAIHEHLNGRAQLLIFDNCEHLLSAIAPLVHELLVRHPLLSVLATSREQLGVSGERVYRVPQMRESAVALFFERAHAVRPELSDSDETRAVVARICERLDGLPLAIELAAARARVLLPDQILAHLDDRFRLLTGGATTSLPRHRTLKALIDWSYEQLEEKEKRFFSRLSVFSGGFTLEAAEAVGTGDGIEPWEALDLLGRLVDKSLVEMLATAHLEGRARYRMLDTLQAYARRTLGPRSPAEGAHRAYFGELARAADDEMNGPGQKDALERVEADLANLKRAVETGLDQIPAADEALSISIVLLGFGRIRGRWAEMRAIGESILSRPETRAGISRGLGHLHHRLGTLAQVQGDITAAVEHFDAAGRIWDQLGDRRNQAGILNNRGLIAHRSGDYVIAEEMFRRALALNREHGHRDLESTNLNNLGLCASDQDRIDEAHAYYAQAAEIAREMGNDYYLAMFLDNLATVCGALGDAEEARQLHEESLALHRKLGNRRGEATALVNLASVLRDLDRNQEAYEYIRQGLAIKQEIGDTRGVVFSLESAAVTLWALGEVRPIVRFLGAALAAREAWSMPRGGGIARECDRHLALARSEMSGEEFAGLWEAGRKLLLEEAAAEAMALRPGSTK